MNSARPSEMFAQGGGRIIRHNTPKINHDNFKLVLVPTPAKQNTGLRDVHKLSY